MDVSKILFPAGKRLDISNFTDSSDFVTLKVIPITEKHKIASYYSSGIDIKKTSEILAKKGKDMKEILVELESDPNLFLKILTESELKEVLKDVDQAQNIIYKIKVLASGVDKNKHSFVDDKGRSVELTEKFWENLGTFAPSLFEYIYNEVENYQKEYSLGGEIGKISSTQL